MQEACDAIYGNQPDLSYPYKPLPPPTDAEVTHDVRESNGDELNSNQERLIDWRARKDQAFDPSAEPNTTYNPFSSIYPTKRNSPLNGNRNQWLANPVVHSHEHPNGIF